MTQLPTRSRPQRLNTEALRWCTGAISYKDGVSEIDQADGPSLVETPAMPSLGRPASSTCTPPDLALTGGTAPFSAPSDDLDAQNAAQAGQPARPSREDCRSGS
jgi:hypothetical protein